MNKITSCDNYKLEIRYSQGDALKMGGHVLKIVQISLTGLHLFARMLCPNYFSVSLFNAICKCRSLSPCEAIFGANSEHLSCVPHSSTVTVRAYNIYVEELRSIYVEVKHEKSVGKMFQSHNTPASTLCFHQILLEQFFMFVCSQEGNNISTLSKVRIDQPCPTRGQHAAQSKVLCGPV